MIKNLLSEAMRSVWMKCGSFLLTAHLCSSALAAQIKPPPKVSGELKDVIVSSAGVREGKLAGCVGSVCSMDNTSTFGIVGIGLKVDVRSRPSPPNPVRDEIRYHDGTVHPGRLVGINAELVVTDRGRHQRALVAWISIGPTRETRNQPGQIGAPGETPEETVIKPPKEEVKDGGETGDNVPPGSGTPAGRPGGLWTGKITQRWIERHPGGGVLRVTTTIDDIRLREYVQPMHVVEGGKVRQVGTITSLFPKGGRISDRVRDLSNVGGNGPGSHCTDVGGGTTTLVGSDISASYIWKKNGTVDTTTGVGWNVPAGPGLYHIGLALHTLGGYSTTRTCVSRNGTDVSTGERGFHSLYLGRIPPDQQPVDPEFRSLDSTGNRMIGSYTNTRIHDGAGSLIVSWSICCEGVTCAAPPTTSDGAISLGDLFEFDMAVLRDSVGDPKLAGVVSKIETDPDGRPDVRVVVKDGGDRIFLEMLARARILKLGAWFAEHGVDASRIDWSWESGSSNDVLVTY